MSAPIPQTSFMSSEALKEEGNTLFKQKKFKEALTAYTKAIAMDETNFVLYSNRAMVQIKLHNGPSALKDAKKCVQLCDDPKFVKGHLREAQAHRLLNAPAAAFQAVQEGLKKVPDDPLLLKVRAELSNFATFTDKRVATRVEEILANNWPKEAAHKIRMFYQTWKFQCERTCFSPMIQTLSIGGKILAFSFITDLSFDPLDLKEHPKVVKVDKLCILDEYRGQGLEADMLRQVVLEHGEVECELHDLRPIGNLAKGGGPQGYRFVDAHGYAGSYIIVSQVANSVGIAQIQEGSTVRSTTYEVPAENLDKSFLLSSALHIVGETVHIFLSCISGAASLIYTITLGQTQPAATFYARLDDISVTALAVAPLAASPVPHLLLGCHGPHHLSVRSVVLEETPSVGPVVVTDNDCPHSRSKEVFTDENRFVRLVADPLGRFVVCVPEDEEFISIAQLPADPAPAVISLAATAKSVVVCPLENGNSRLLVETMVDVTVAMLDNTGTVIGGSAHTTPLNDPATFTPNAALFTEFDDISYNHVITAWESSGRVMLSTVTMEEDAQTPGSDPRQGSIRILDLTSSTPSTVAEFVLERQSGNGKAGSRGPQRLRDPRWVGVWETGVAVLDDMGEVLGTPGRGGRASGGRRDTPF
ncbi:TPR repeat [Carpediemonas membranifera]|uniref:TPR repeat n=1 Tax=Carpediemonas membranifera TaxID=201153 RepID=A0A8J6DYR8_9EUKA|nr:TPR repeat [Carpediemonas membranifera]|eukprot:KAG9389471.1 TPR repeat [Carpediemonas membranifera]